jgi:hypothetical protein
MPLPGVRRKQRHGRVPTRFEFDFSLVPGSCDHLAVPDNRSQPEARVHAEKEFALNLLKAAPDLEPHLEGGYFDFEAWDSADGMGFMYELLRACARLIDRPEGKVILPRVFAYLENKAAELELHASSVQKLSPADFDAIHFLLFTFTDNPTGKDPTLKRLTPFMGPKINEMCTQLS